MTSEDVLALQAEAEKHLTHELLPFWLQRCKDETHGGFITHFDEDGRDTGEDQKSLIAQTRVVYAFAAAHRAGYGDGECADYARHGVDFLLAKMWDGEYGGFFWTVDRRGEVQIDKKIVYGQSFAIYALAEYALATGDRRGQEYAETVFDLLQKHAADALHGGYFEMFERNWDLRGPGAAGGDRKTLDVHMHLMEALTRLYECSGKAMHRRRLQDLIEILVRRLLHPKYKTGIPQFWRDWRVAPQIQFDIVWGWDRFAEGGKKRRATDITSYGHNVEFAWLLLHALDILGADRRAYDAVIRAQFEHCLAHGIDWQYGGVYVEGAPAGGVYDRDKEFWQQAEALIGLLDACRFYDAPAFWPAYKNVHRFVFDKVIHHEIGEWWPLLRRDGQPIWRHMGHSWKVNYHTIRAMLESIKRLQALAEQAE